MIAAVLAVGGLLAKVDIPGAWNYVAAAYVLTFAAIIGYAAWVIVRGRKVGKQLPPEERRWS